MENLIYNEVIITDQPAQPGMRTVNFGQLTQVTDAAGTRRIGYNRYGEAETDSLLAGSMTHTITEQRGTPGRSTGHVYAKNDIPQQQTAIGYGEDGRIATAGFTHQGEHKAFTTSYIPGTHLLHTLTHPNVLTLTQSYDATRDLPAGMSYSRADTASCAAPCKNVVFLS